MTTTATAVVRRATTEDAGLLLSMTSRFVARSPFWGHVAAHDEAVRTLFLQAIGSAAGTAHLGVVYVLEEHGEIVGVMVGLMTSPPWSRAVVAEEVGGWVDDKHFDRVEDLREALRRWAKGARSPVIRFGDVVEKL